MGMHVAKRVRSSASKVRRRSRLVAKTKRPSVTVARPKNSVRRIDARLKGLALAVEPPLDADPADLFTAFREKLQSTLAQLQGANTPFKLVEGYRTVERQQWLYGSGRPNAQPYGRPGPIVTNADGVRKKSKHQGDGSAGSGLAADCYPTKNGRVYIPPSSDPLWGAYASAVAAQGLIAGHNWPALKDSPHCEYPDEGLRRDSDDHSGSESITRPATR